MKINLLLVILLFTSVISPQSKGHLFIIGGGERPEYMMKKIIQLAGGKDSKIIIIPNASGEKIETAEYQLNQFKEYGCSNADYLLFDSLTVDADSNLKKLDGATGIFFSGGDQSRLTRDMLGSKLLNKVRSIYNSGGVLSGTSAGAAVMSKIMLTGNELINTDPDNAYISIQKGNIETVEGFGFIESAVIDQHFIKRKRNNRLISVVLENPSLLGIGIDEATAILVYPNKSFEVVGENQVIIYDAGKADIKPGKNDNLSAQGMKMHILSDGQKFSLDKKETVE